MLNTALTGACMAACAGAWAGGELTSPSAIDANTGYGDGVMASQIPMPAPVGLAGDIYQEYFTYGAHVRRSFIPGYIPQTESLWENPRTPPSAVCKIAEPYRYANIRGWFFGSPNGYQSSVPPDSIAHAYVTGQLGITTSLQYGYPRGMRVIEPVIVPFAAHAEAGGLLITGDGVAVRVPQPPAMTQMAETLDEEQLEKIGSPVDMAVPSRAPMVPEVLDK